MCASLRWISTGSSRSYCMHQRNQTPSSKAPASHARRESSSGRGHRCGGGREPAFQGRMSPPCKRNGESGPAAKSPELSWMLNADAIRHMLGLPLMDVSRMRSLGPAAHNFIWRVDCATARSRLIPANLASPKRCKNASVVAKRNRPSEPVNSSTSLRSRSFTTSPRLSASKSLSISAWLIGCLKAMHASTLHQGLHRSHERRARCNRSTIVCYRDAQTIFSAQCVERGFFAVRQATEGFPLNRLLVHGFKITSGPSPGWVAKINGSMPVAATTNKTMITR
jgi:hypothetical protein